MLRRLLAATVLVTPALAKATVTTFAEYHLGEAGSLGATNLPRDSSGNTRNFGNQISGATTTVVTADIAPNAAGSTAYLSTAGAGNEGFYGTFSTGLGADNYAFGIFARAASNDAATQGTIFSINGTTGGYNLSLGANGWEAGIHTNGTGTTAAFSSPTGVFTANTWAHLAVIRSAGVSTFYINGVAQTGTTGTVSTLGNMHLSVNPGGTVYFDGHLDEARVVQFTAGEPTGAILGALGYAAIPEPSAYGLLGAGALAAAVALRRRRRAR